MSSLSIFARKGKKPLHYFFKETALKSLEYARYKIIDSFYIVGAIELDKPGIGRKVLRLPRKLAFYFHQDLRPEYLWVFL